MADFNVNEFKEGVDNLFKNIAEGLPNITQIIAKDAIAVVKNRIQERGVDSEGSTFPAYSEAYKKKKANSKTGNKNTSYRDFTASGDMLRRLDIVSAGDESGKYVVRVGGKTDDAQDKIDGNSFGNGKWEGVGDILEVSDKEQEGFQETMDDELQKIIDKSGFGK